MKHARSRAILSLLGIVTSLFPMVWLVVSAFRPEADIISRPYSVPAELTLDNFRELFAMPGIYSSIAASLAVATLCTVLTLCIVIPSGYLLARFVFPGKTLLAWAMVSGYILAPAVLALPYFVLLRVVGLLNSQLGIALGHVASALPFAIVMSALMFLSVPVGIEEVAEIAGSSFSRRILTVALPAIRFQCVGLATLVFAISWKEFFLAFIVSSGVRTRTLPVLLASLSGGESVNWHLVCALSTLLIVPAAVIAFGGMWLRSTKLIVAGSRG